MGSRLFSASWTRSSRSARWAACVGEVPTKEHRGYAVELRIVSSEINAGARRSDDTEAIWCEASDTPSLGSSCTYRQHLGDGGG